MELPVLFQHELETGVVSRIKQYEIKAHKFLVDLDEDARVFLDQFHLVAEGQRAIELSKPVEPVKPAADDVKSDADKIEPKPNKSNKAASKSDSKQAAK